VAAPLSNEFNKKVFAEDQDFYLGKKDGHERKEDEERQGQPD